MLSISSLQIQINGIDRVVELSDNIKGKWTLRDLVLRDGSISYLPAVKRQLSERFKTHQKRIIYSCHSIVVIRSISKCPLHLSVTAQILAPTSRSWIPSSGLAATLWRGLEYRWQILFAQEFSNFRWEHGVYTSVEEDLEHLW